MKITRNTMRADGITVGEAMDRNAAFLRSIGFDAKVGQPTYDERVEALEQEADEYADSFGHKVLDAMDEIVGSNGWLDKDLHDLLPAIHQHAKKLHRRLNEKRYTDLYL